MPNIERVQQLAANPPEEIVNALRGDIVAMASECAAALGTPYMLGKFEIPVPTLGILPLLEGIESPIIDGTSERLSAADVMRALYVMAMGAAAVKPVMQMHRRKAALHGERERAAKDPMLYEVYLRQLDNLERTWVEFDEAVARWWEENVGGVPMHEAAEVMFRALNDAIAGLVAIPRGEEKKTRR